MTIALALTGTNGVVCATDSRSTWRDTYNDMHVDDDTPKLFFISKYAVVMGVGTMQITYAVVNAVRAKGREDLLVNEVAKMVYDAYPPGGGSMLMVAGYEIEDGKMKGKVYKIHETDDGRRLEYYTVPTCAEGRTRNAVPILADYDTGALPVNELVPLAILAITEGEQDIYVGGPVQICTITPYEGVKFLTETEIGMAVKAANETAYEKKGEDPLSILKVRYVKGEITKEQYEEMRDVIAGGPG